MDCDMRRILNVDCEGATLAATLDDAPGTSGLLIVSGGNEIRIGAHRGMARLAADIAASSHPVFRFDRRGIGDSEGENGGFLSSGADIAASIAAFRAACPNVQRIIAFGNCDAATALVLHRPEGISAYVLANPWVIKASEDAPPPAAIKAHYRARVRDPKAWIGLFTGAINLRKLVRGLVRVSAAQAPSTLSGQVASGLEAIKVPIHILLAERDGTAIAFAAEWQKPAFARAREEANITSIDSASHSFASEEDYAALKGVILSAFG
jgi:exosortase A-associated hydrolase 1